MITPDLINHDRPLFIEICDCCGRTRQLFGKTIIRKGTFNAVSVSVICCVWCKNNCSCEGKPHESPSVKEINQFSRQ